MIKVNNKKAIRTLSSSSFKANKTRNIIAVISIALTTILFISLFTIGGTMIESSQNYSFRMLGTKAHGTFKYLTQAEFEAIKDNTRLKEISYSIPIAANTTTPELNKLSVEILYREDSSAKWSFCYPTSGTMPKEYYDLATSTLVLDALGVSHKLGEKVTLSFDIDGIPHVETFNLVGFWEGDSALPAQQIHLSKAFQQDTVPVATESYFETTQVVGTINADVFFSNSFNTENKIHTVLEESGLPIDKIYTGVN